MRIEKKKTQTTNTHTAHLSIEQSQRARKTKRAQREKQRKRGNEGIKENITEHTDIDQQIQCAYNDYMATERTSELIEMNNGLLNRSFAAAAASIRFVCCTIL